uniref:Uncharacterized protein n=2 Tax=Cyanophyceae TaxID=3028117 RepID=A0A8T6QXA4_9CYAN
MNNLLNQLFALTRSLIPQPLLPKLGAGGPEKVSLPVLGEGFRVRAKRSRRGRSLPWLLSGLGLVWAIALLPPAQANMANPEWPGHLLTEPWTDVATLAIVHEDLVLDLRPLETERYAHIQATYTINNPGEATTVALLFAAPGLESGTVTLDGTQAIAATPTAAPTIPDDWDDASFYQEVQGLEFQVPLSSGQHEIAVNYQGLPSSDDAGVYREYTLQYWLAPARQWQSFGTLTVDVFAPSNWETMFDPDLAGVEAGHWQQTFDGLPGDVLTIASRPLISPIAGFLRGLSLVVGVAIAFAVTGWLYYWLGGISQRHAWSGGGLVLTFLLVMPLSIPLFWGLSGLGVWGSESLLSGAHLGVSYRYSRMMMMLLGGVIAAPAGLLTAIFGFVYGRQQRPPQPVIDR